MSDWTMPDGSPGYVSIDEIEALYGRDELVQMTDRTGSDAIDQDYLVSALRSAQGTANVCLAARYAVPLATVPDAVKTAIADLARARLYPRGAPDGVAQAAKDATALFQRISTGQLPLGLPGGEQATEAASETPVLFTPGHRAYPDGLDGY